MKILLLVFGLFVGCISYAQQNMAIKNGLNGCWMMNNEKFDYRNIYYFSGDTVYKIQAGKYLRILSAESKLADTLNVEQYLYKVISCKKKKREYNILLYNGYTKQMPSYHMNVEEVHNTTFVFKLINDTIAKVTTDKRDNDGYTTYKKTKQFNKNYLK